MLWTDVNDCLPIEGAIVLAATTSESGISGVVRAYYTHAERLADDDEMFGNAAKYDYEICEYVILTGWYEASLFMEMDCYIEDLVTHWMILPEPPNPRR